MSAISSANGVSGTLGTLGDGGLRLIRSTDSNGGIVNGYIDFGSESVNDGSRFYYNAAIHAFRLESKVSNSYVYLTLHQPNSRLGIGTANPSYPLEVIGKTRVSGSLQISRDSAEICGPSTYGTIKVENGRLWMCRQ